MDTARNFGKPLDLGDGYEQTPAEERMGYKILKDAGDVPFEFEVMRDIEALNRTVAGLPEGDAKRVQQQRLSDLRQQLALMPERLKLTDAL
ncbi:MAG: DnaJ family domain-containing protein [Rhodoferax sp.]